MTKRREILTLAEAARYLRCHPSTLYRLPSSERKFRAFKVSADFRFIKSELDRWVREQTAKTQRRE
jgi:excisionase family DNA binding protein